MRDLEDALRVEQELLARVRELIAELPPDNSYRLVLERNERMLRDVIAQIEDLEANPGARLTDEGFLK